MDRANVSAGQNLPTAGQQGVIVATMGSKSSNQRKGAPWARPVLRTIPNPTGEDWAATAAVAPDQTALIQGLVDRANTSLAVLSAGMTWHIAGTLLMSGACGVDGVFDYGVGCAKSGLIGAGDSMSAIVAKSRTLKMINVATVGDPGGYGSSIYLAGMTLQGGRCGICSANTTGAVVNAILISHVTFRDFSEAGVLVDGVMGWDNNILDFLNFINCDTGVKQLGRCGPSCGQPNGAISYMDKNVYFRNQFINNRVAIDLRVMDHSDGANHWIECYFLNNTEYSFTGSGMTSATHFANSVFMNNGGNPTINWDTPGASVTTATANDSSTTNINLEQSGNPQANPQAATASLTRSNATRDCVNQTWMAAQPSCPIWSRAFNVISCLFNSTSTSSNPSPRSMLPAHVFVEGSEFIGDTAATLLPVVHGAIPGMWADGSVVMMQSRVGCVHCVKSCSDHILYYIVLYCTVLYCTTVTSY